MQRLCVWHSFFDSLQFFTWELSGKKWPKTFRPSKSAFRIGLSYSFIYVTPLVSKHIGYLESMSFDFAFAQPKDAELLYISWVGNLLNAVCQFTNNIKM